MNTYGVLSQYFKERKKGGECGGGGKSACVPCLSTFHSCWLTSQLQGTRRRGGGRKKELPAAPLSEALDAPPNSIHSGENPDYLPEARTLLAAGRGALCPGQVRVDLVGYLGWEWEGRELPSPWSAGPALSRAADQRPTVQGQAPTQGTVCVLAPSPSRAGPGPGDGSRGRVPGRRLQGAVARRGARGAWRPPGELAAGQTKTMTSRFHVHAGSTD